MCLYRLCCYGRKGELQQAQECLQIAMQNQGIMKATSLQVESPLFPDSTAEELGGTFGALREANLPLYHLNLCTIHARQKK